jgi:hypothetical protein
MSCTRFGPDEITHRQFELDRHNGKSQWARLMLREGKQPICRGAGTAPSERSARVDSNIVQVGEYELRKLWAMN